MSVVSVGAGLESPPRRVPYRTWPGALIVVAIIFVYVGGLVLWDAHTPNDFQNVESGAVLQVGPAVGFVPAKGWLVDVTDSSPTGDSASIFLTGRGSTFSVRTQSWDGTLAEFVTLQRSEISVFGKVHLVGDPAAFTTASGVSGLTFSYYAKQTQGQVWISVDQTTKRAVVVISRASQTAFTQAQPDVQQMLDSLKVSS